MTTPRDELRANIDVLQRMVTASGRYLVAASEALRGVDPSELDSAIEILDVDSAIRRVSDDPRAVLLGSGVLSGVEAPTREVVDRLTAIGRIVCRIGYFWLSRSNDRLPIDGAIEVTADNVLWGGGISVRGPAWCEGSFSEGDLSYTSIPWLAIDASDDEIAEAAAWKVPVTKLAPLGESGAGRCWEMALLPGGHVGCTSPAGVRSEFPTMVEALDAHMPFDMGAIDVESSDVWGFREALRNWARSSEIAYPIIIDMNDEYPEALVRIDGSARLIPARLEDWYGYPQPDDPFHEICWSYDAMASNGPYREYIGRFDDLYYLVKRGGETDVTCLGVFESCDDAVAASQEFSEADMFRQYEFDKDEDLEQHDAEDSGAHALFRHWTSLPHVYWAPNWHADGKGAALTRELTALLEGWGVPGNSTGAYVSAMGSSYALLDGFVLLRHPRDSDGWRESGDIEGVLIAGPLTFRLICDLADVMPPADAPPGEHRRPGEGAPISAGELQRILAWQLEHRQEQLRERLELIRLVQKCEEAEAIASGFLEHREEVLPDVLPAGEWRLEESRQEMSVLDLLTPLERFDANSPMFSYTIDGKPHLSVNCRREGDSPAVPTRFTGTELRTRRDELCERCSGWLLAVLDAFDEAGEPATDQLSIGRMTFDNKGGNPQSAGEGFMFAAIRPWTRAPDMFDEVGSTAVVTGEQLALLRAYWRALDRRNLPSMLVPID